MAGRVAVELELTLRLHAEQLSAAVEAQPELAVVADRDEIERRVVAPQRRRRTTVELPALVRHLERRLGYVPVGGVRRQVIPSDVHRSLAGRDVRRAGWGYRDPQWDDRRPPVHVERRAVARDDREVERERLHVRPGRRLDRQAQLFVARGRRLRVKTLRI